MDSTATVVGLVGVYHADGGPIGEAKYVLGKLLGTAHCALCDITHSPVRRKPAWDRMVAGLGVDVELLHLNEMSPEVAAATATARLTAGARAALRRHRRAAPAAGGPRGPGRVGRRIRRGPRRTLSRRRATAQAEADPDPDVAVASSETGAQAS